MNSQEVVTPVKTGVESFYNCLNALDSPSAVSPSVMSPSTSSGSNDSGPNGGFCRNDGKRSFLTSYEFVNPGFVPSECPFPLDQVRVVGYAMAKVQGREVV